MVKMTGNAPAYNLVPINHIDAILKHEHINDMPRNIPRKKLGTLNSFLKIITKTTV